MPHTPPTNQQLDEYEAVFDAAAEIGAGIEVTTGRLLLAEVRRQRALADRTRALSLLEAANYLCDAHHQYGLNVQEIGTALRHQADEADPMVGSLARDGFGLEEIADMLARPAAPAVVETGE